MATMQMPKVDRIMPTPVFQIPTAGFDGSTGPRIIGPQDGKFADLKSIGVRFMIWGAETGGTFSLVEHPIPPRTLVAPLHLHTREDEYSYVLEGRMGAQLATTWSTPSRVTSCSSRGISGTRSGMPATPPAGCWRSSRPPASSTSSTSWASRWRRQRR